MGYRWTIYILIVLHLVKHVLEKYTSTYDLMNIIALDKVRLFFLRSHLEKNTT